MFSEAIINAASALHNIFLVKGERYLVKNANFASHALHGVFLPADYASFSADTCQFLAVIAIVG